MPRNSQRGLSDSVPWAILTPLILLVILGSIQIGIVAHGRTIATHAAIAAAEEAAQLGAGPDRARSLAASVAAAGGLTDLVVAVDMGPETVRATVSGRMPTFIDLGQSSVDAQATRPRERVTRP